MPVATLSQNQHKATIYRLLSACYYQPEESFVTEEIFGQLATALAGTFPGGEKLASRLGIAFRQEGLDDLLYDYSRLFLGPFEIPAKPYGSVYLEGEKVIMGNSTLNALAYYREADFQVAEDFRELPDHVAVELEFLYLLSFKQNEAMAGNDPLALTRWLELEQLFLQNHLGCWTKKFCRRIQDHAGTDFYRLLADLTEKYVFHQRV